MFEIAGDLNVIFAPFRFLFFAPLRETAPEGSQTYPNRCRYALRIAGSGRSLRRTSKTNHETHEAHDEITLGRNSFVDSCVCFSFYSCVSWSIFVVPVLKRLAIRSNLVASLLSVLTRNFSLLSSLFCLLPSVF